MEDVDIRRRIILSLLKLNEIFKNSAPGKVAYIWHIERVQIDASKFERTQIHQFFYQRFHCRRRRPCLRSLLTFSLKEQIINKSPLPKRGQPLKIGGWRVSFSFFSRHSGILSGEMFYLMFESIYSIYCGDSVTEIF